MRCPVRCTSRTMSTPKVCAGAFEKRSWLNGMRNSAVHPSESMLAAPSHTPSHDGSSLESL
jgi:hypothetical protein